MQPAPPMPLEEALSRVDRVFGIESFMRESERDIVAPYYTQSERGFRRLHSEEGAMHMALNPGGRFDAEGYLGQARGVEAEMASYDARRVLEVGCGFGYNSLHLARNHPDVRFSGIDLMKRHAREAGKRAAGMANLDFRQGSFEPLDTDPEGFDLIFGVECLCHASDVDLVVASIARSLRPGGRLMIYDGYRRAPLDHVPADMVTATRLTEIAMAVTQGFRTTAYWTAAMERAGLSVIRNDDLTAQVAPTFRRLQRAALKFFDGGWKARVAQFVVRPYLLRNAAAGLLGPYTIEGAEATLSYNLLVAEKPAAD